ncbi:MAG: insulinase family protein [Bacteroidota bacterium]|nr:insulinase family protein [Bacteroidota bacterium]
MKSKSTMQLYTRFILKNGLTVLMLPDSSSKMVAVSVLYRVGSRDEQEGKTGLAHLFEHLMFSNCGSGIDFDEIMQNAGGESNAFTTTDTTQYYNVAPADQIELILELEARRMNGFKLKKQDFKIQQQVVIEEFSEHYLNNPYGLFSHKIMPMAYERHPYRWPVIGISQDELKTLTIEDAKEFYESYYSPSNSILVICGQFDTSTCEEQIKKHFESIPSGHTNKNKYDQETSPQNKKVAQVEATIPEDALYIAFRSAGRIDHDFYTLDFLTDVLAEGKSSLLYSKLKKEKMWFSSIDCYMTSTTDPGLIVLEGKINNGIQLEQAEEGIWEIIENMKQELISDHEWQKYMNKNESAYLFSQLGVINQALNLSYCEWLGDPDMIYTELEHYKKITKEDIRQAAQKYFDREQACYLYYKRI